MDTRAQLRKYKIQINELSDVWQASRQREINIHKAEMERIAAKTAEFRESCQLESETLLAQKLVILDEISVEQSKLDKVGDALNQLHNTKFKLRQEVLLQIQAENRAKKDIKRNRAVFDKQLQDLQTQIDMHQKQIDNYEIARRHINEDFYNWRDECAEIRQKISELTPNDKKSAILNAYLNELATDIRANTDPRYNQLDAEKTMAQSAIEHLGYQYNKMQTYMNSFNETLVSQGEQVMSSYLRDASAEIPRLKSEQKELREKIGRMWEQIAGIEQQITELGTMDIPAELKEQTERAEQRLRISGERATSEYEPLINKLREKVSCLELELLQQQHTPQQVITNIQQETINPESSQPSGNSVDGSDTGTESGAPNHLAQLGQEIDFTGKSRKEIEKLKKQQRQLVEN
jgi:chromosome segregation ATPase